MLKNVVSEQDESPPLDPVEDVFQRTTPESLEKIRRPDLGPLNFEAVIPTVVVIRDLAKAAASQDALLFPVNWATNWGNQFIQLGVQLTLISDFSIDQENPRAAHDAIVENIENLRQWFVVELIPRLRADVLDWQRTRADAVESLNGARAAAGEAGAILQDLKKRSGETAAGRLAHYFHHEASQYKAEASRNFRLTLATVVALGVLVVGLFWIWPIDQTTRDDRWEEFVRGLAPRLLVLGLAAYALSFFARNYRVARHQQVINEHKRNALDTYVLFVDAVAGDARDAVTAEVVRRAFEPSETGYVPSSADRTIIEAPTILSALRPQ